jgi:DNA-binding transcriptional LysR family regulator
MSWACSKGFVVGEGRPIPFLSWPKSVSDRVATKALADSNASYEVAVVASDLTTHLAAARAGLGVFAMPRRILPPDMKVADFHYLPRLPGTISGVCTNEAVPKAEASLLLGAIANAMAPNLVLSSAQGILTALRRSHVPVTETVGTHCRIDSAFIALMVSDTAD